MEKPSIWMSVTTVVTIALSLNTGSCSASGGSNAGGGSDAGGASDSGSGGSDSGGGGLDATGNVDATASCGASAQSCCSGATCNVGLACIGGTCSATDGGEAGTADAGGVCTPGQLGCDGQQPQTCGSSGQWQSSGAACTAGQTCVSGACAGVCGPGQTTCVGNTPQTCDASGAWQPAAACSGTTPYCAEGSCVQCASDSECAGTTNDCGHPSCANNLCAMVYTAANTPTTSNPPQVPGDCHQIVCDGTGGTSSSVDDTDVPNSGTVCITDQCVSGAVVPTNNPGVTCGMSGTILEVCDSAGQCGCHSSGDCTLPNTCGGGGTALVCGCTPATCASLGQTCGGPFSDQCFSSLACNDHVRDGTETDIDCGGVTTANSTCVVTCGSGQKCNVGSDCESGFCTDGVCCNSACLGTCEACSAAAKGQGSDGVCGAVKLGDDPHGNCSNMGVASCGESGGCNGSGACSIYAAGSLCEAATCSTSTVLTKAETCISSACKAPSQPTQDCTPFLCSGGACTTSCTGDTQCAATAYCFAGSGANHDTCQPKLGTGDGTCTAADQCSSNVCGTNGICCAATCPVTNPPCGQTGACAPSTGACEQAAAGTSCSKVVGCSGGMLTSDTQCDGFGSCSSATTTSACPGSFTCIATASPIACGCGANSSAGDAVCPTMQWCDGTSNGNAGACQAPQAAGQPCNRDSQCTGGCNLAAGTCN